MKIYEGTDGLRGLVKKLIEVYDFKKVVFEGDKPLKYPYMFAGADICIINKIDLLPYVDSDVARLKDNALKINPQLCFFEISATRGMGMDEWCEYLLACFERKEEK